MGLGFEDKQTVALAVAVAAAVAALAAADSSVFGQYAAARAH